jgi:hypothetical protein
MSFIIPIRDDRPKVSYHDSESAGWIVDRVRAADPDGWCGKAGASSLPEMTAIYLAFYKEYGHSVVGKELWELGQGAGLGPRSHPGVPAVRFGKCQSRCFETGIAHGEVGRQKSQ